MGEKLDAVVLSGVATTLASSSSPLAQTFYSSFGPSLQALKADTCPHIQHFEEFFQVYHHHHRATGWKARGLGRRSRGRVWWVLNAPYMHTRASSRCIWAGGHHFPFLGSTAPLECSI